MVNIPLFTGFLAPSQVVSRISEPSTSWKSRTFPSKSTFLDGFLDYACRTRGLRDTFLEKVQIEQRQLGFKMGGELMARSKLDGFRESIFSPSHQFDGVVKSCIPIHPDDICILMIIIKIHFPTIHIFLEITCCVFIQSDSQYLMSLYVYIWLYIDIYIYSCGAIFWRELNNSTQHLYVFIHLLSIIFLWWFRAMIPLLGS